MNDTLAIILGGGQGARLFPLTATRSKPAVPIGGKYRLIDVPISGCLHADIRRIFVLTQFNSASLNRHISNTYRLDRFSGGFVEILAAEQTPDNPQLVSGHGRRRPPGGAPLRAARRRVLPDPRRRPSLPDGLRASWSTRTRRSGADITIAAQPVDAETATQMGIFRFDRDGSIVGVRGEAEGRRGSREIGRSIPPAPRSPTHSDEQPFMASMGVYVFSRRCCSRCWSASRATTSAAS